MSLVPHYLSSDRASQWPGPDEGQQDEQGEDYFAQTGQGGGQLPRLLGRALASPWIQRVGFTQQQTANHGSGSDIYSHCRLHHLHCGSRHASHPVHRRHGRSQRAAAGDGVHSPHYLGGDGGACRLCGMAAGVPLPGCQARRLSCGSCIDVKLGWGCCMPAVPSSNARVCGAGARKAAARASCILWKGSHVGA
ncbi:hypothetical protein HaLaN_19367 [Haematococcus lacustris]|uniref:Uncharacterized protein n=1 Tax=Haematococcus lacustris TaxID=44745 RepID=A0A699ZT86_HAELA|nr:hypothetical protein HaLaN_19367 [Haematococcus lacustris]